MAQTATTSARAPLLTSVTGAYRFLRRWPVFPVFILVLLIVTGTSAQWIAPHDPLRGSLMSSLNPPSWYDEGSTKNILGADKVGRDILSRVIYGARISLMVAAVSLTSGMIVGTAIGLLSGYIGGIVDDAIMRVVDVWLGLPFLLVALVITVVLGQSLVTLLGVLALLTWAGFVRNVRGEVLS
ncbi:MAG: ABC transporter permease, partial [Chloroflexota bacterium]|nr:ABC transporter permease [Chloroflexota bacterium]